eukprot:2523631-Ditylum_brightwellii.AAC.1
MDVVDRGDQACIKGTGFRSKSYYKKWYKKDHSSVADSRLFNSNVAWNLSCPLLDVNGQNTYMPL